MNNPLGLVLLLILSWLAGCGSDHRMALSSRDSAGQAVKVNWFEYHGKDAMFVKPPPDGHYQNPILAGFYPDPSIVRGEDAFYMVHSSFGYFPGIPISRSTDLVNWQSLGHVLTRENQLNLNGLGTSRGIFAPTIRYHKGVYYVITTNVDSPDGNFIVTSRDPAGPWSDPILLPEVQGIDPSMFFDDDGRVYITHNDAPPEEPLYEGHRAIWMWEYDLKSEKVVPGSRRLLVNGGADIDSEPVWIEGPHIYKINGWYYLLCAEGGTSVNHSEVVFRTRSLREPFVPYHGNPILTQRDLPADRTDPVASTGHVDLIQTPQGEWWAVFLGTRNYQRDHFNTGRETFLLPVMWHDDWPIILPPGEPVPRQPFAPVNLPATAAAHVLTGNIQHRDSFEKGLLSFHWNSLRGDTEDWVSFAETGGLLITPRSVQLNQRQQPAFIGRRQQNLSFTARLNFELPGVEGVLAGLALYQSEQSHFFMGVKKSGTHYRVLLERAHQTAPEVVSSKVFAEVGHGTSITMMVDASQNHLGFSFQLEGREPQRLGREHDARVLSTQWAGGFVGTYVGIHARKTESILDLKGP